VHAKAALPTLSKIVAGSGRSAGGVRSLPDKDYFLAIDLLGDITHVATPLVPRYKLRALSKNLFALGQVSWLLSCPALA
jgi:hypothetical protein